MTPEEIGNISINDLINAGGFDCACGRRHTAGTEKVVVGEGAIKCLPELIGESGAKKPFILSGAASYAAAGPQVREVLEGAGIDYSLYVFPVSPVKPTEETVGAAVMHFDPSCDLVIGIGSGVINDTGKILAGISGRRYIIVATAPSMDGFASATSSMDRDGLKVSLNSTFAWGIVGDVDILKSAPMHMLQAGVGDMLAKYISIAEWQIAHIITGEYYCPTIAALVRKSLERVVTAAPGLVKREPDAVQAVMEGMLIAGMAMKYAGLSRPASGIEHYFSHIWDMRALAFKDSGSELHGIQCGVATLYSLRVYEYIRNMAPDREKALRYAERFSIDEWNRSLLSFIGPGAEAMIEGERREGKYDREKHRKRLEIILNRWDDIMNIIDTMPSYDIVYDFMVQIGAPVSAGSFGYTGSQIRTTFTMTKDIRDKYVGSRLLWDLGTLDEAAEAVFPD